MLKDSDIVYFAPETWDGLWRNRQQLMSVFARQNKVLFVERRSHVGKILANLRRGKLGLADLRRPSLRQVSENLFVFRYPAWAPICGRFDQLPKRIRRRFFQNALRELGMSEPIVWFSRPGMVNLLDEAPAASLRLYHVVDEYTAYSGQTPAERRQAEKWEQEMLARVDAVVVVSKKLYENKRLFNPNTYLVPNGVNYQAYTAALADPALPADLESIKTPRLGYIGLIGDKLDFEMLLRLAQERPDWSLVLLGETRVIEQAETWQKLQALPNVHRLGPVDVSQVPHYVKGFQVGLMPYLQNRHAENISPLKLYDYLAAGIPIASVDIPAVQKFGQHIYLAAEASQFPAAVAAALAGSAEQCQIYRDLAAQHTWEARVEQLSELIERQLAARAEFTPVVA